MIDVAWLVTDRTTDNVSAATGDIMSVLLYTWSLFADLSTNHAQIDLSVFTADEAYPQPNMAWRTSLFFNELNLLFPLFFYTGIYRASHLRHVAAVWNHDLTLTQEVKRSMFVTVLCIGRLAATWTALISILLSWQAYSTVGVVFGLNSLAVAAVLIDMEFNLLREEDIAQYDLQSANGVTWFYIVNLMPLNFVFNIIADRSTTLQSVYAIFQSVLRAMLLTVAVTLATVYSTYRDAWSCYMHKAIKDYTSGYCPAYTHAYYPHNLACRDNPQADNLACFGGELPAWKNTHVVVHICSNLIAALYAQHLVTVWVTWVKLSR
jgi:hypothetical protein